MMAGRETDMAKTWMIGISVVCAGLGLVGATVGRPVVESVLSGADSTQAYRIAPNHPERQAVKCIQHAINVIYGNPHALVVDGKYGQKTANAVKRFQQDANLSVDGIVGPRTAPVLAAYFSAKGRDFATFTYLGDPDRGGDPAFAANTETCGKLLGLTATQGGWPYLGHPNGARPDSES